MLLFIHIFSSRFSFFSYILTPFPSLLRKEGRSHDEVSDKMIKSQLVKGLLVSLLKTI
jgi:hypothetical protein